MLFSLPDVGTLATLPCVAGESASPCVFSPDDQHLALIIEPSALWWTGDDDEVDWDTLARGGPVHWATLHVQETRLHGVRAEYPILVELHAGWVPSEKLQGATWPQNVRFMDGTQLTFARSLRRDRAWCRRHRPPERPGLRPAPAPGSRSRS